MRCTSEQQHWEQQALYSHRLTHRNHQGSHQGSHQGAQEIPLRHCVAVPSHIPSGQLVVQSFSSFGKPATAGSCLWSQVGHWKAAPRSQESSEPPAANGNSEFLLSFMPHQYVLISFLHLFIQFCVACPESQAIIESESFASTNLLCHSQRTTKDGLGNKTLVTL